MRLLVKILGSIAAAFAALLIVQYYIGLSNDAFSGPQGMAVVGIQLLIMVSASLSLLFGVLGRMLDLRENLPSSKWSNALILISIIAGLLLLVSPFVFR